MVATPFFRTARIDIHDSTILRFTLPGGSVFDFVHGVVKDAAHFARGQAPMRTGELMRSIEARRPTANRPYAVEGRVYAHAHYARYVHEGTTGPIMAKSGGQLRLAPWGRWPAVYTDSVSGQAPNPFLARGLGMSMAKHGLH